MRLLILALLVLSPACQHPTAPTTAAATTAADGTLPTPYTVEQLRASLPVGHVMRLQIHAPADAPAKLRTWKVSAADADGCTFRETLAGPDGQLIEGPTESRSSFEELRLHAAFPAATTTVEQGLQVTVPAGTFDVVRYTVRGEGGEEVYDFAPSLPGPPVRLVVRAAGIDIMLMEMYSRDPLP
jgi:hypothetical protein